MSTVRLFKTTKQFGSVNRTGERIHREKKMKRKKMQKLFLFYVNINYRIFHVYNNLLLATSGVVDEVVDKDAVPFPSSLNDAADASDVDAADVTLCCC